MDIQKARGLILGIAAGDKNRCPFQLAICILQSLVENGTKYEPRSALVNYLQWYKSKGIGWDDCGPMTIKVFERFLQEDFAEQPIDVDYLKAYSEAKLFNHAVIADAESHGLNASIHAAHRALPLGLLSVHWTWEEVDHAARSDCSLTHVSPVCRATCCALALLAGELLLGASWQQAVKDVAKKVSHCFPVQNALLEGMELSSRPHLSRGSYCVDVLKASIHFLTHTSNFEAALVTSLQFAGPANYAPVIVGSLAGALYGSDAIPESHLRQWERDDLLKTDRLLCSMAAMFSKLSVDSNSQ